MGKTIALKLSEKEQQIVAEINKEGMTNSDLLRTALRHYFEILDRTDRLQEPGKRILELEDIESPMIHDYVEHLKEEVRELREQNMKLQRQIYQMCLNTEQKTKETITEPNENTSDVHEQIDDFLKHQYP